jgi:hypothetical protein
MTFLSDASINELKRLFAANFLTARRIFQGVKMDAINLNLAFFCQQTR